MNRTTHQVAERGIHQAVPSQRQLAGELFADDHCLEMHAVIAKDFDLCVTESGLDQITNLAGLHGFPREFGLVHDTRRTMRSVRG